MIYSIGTSNRTLEEFIRTLQKHEITIAIDVRSRPTSRFPHFRQKALAAELALRDIDYIWLGDVLGGEPSMHITADQQDDAMGTIVQLASHQHVVVFCAEGDPAQCHRSWNIGQQLLQKWGLVTVSVLRNGSLEDVDETLSRTVR
ncbi:DUF488 domain-containing protein [Hyphomonas sp.]|uniref:DUF488 domain-containing protein n=1 Tax=Hyphomonas sp. TaxID=87 RepID=UPI0030F72B4E